MASVQIGDTVTEFSSIEEAWEEAKKADGTEAAEITLLADTSVKWTTLKVEDGDNIILNGDVHKLISGASPVIEVTGGRLAITSGEFIAVDGSSHCLEITGGNVTLTGGTYTSAPAPWGISAIKSEHTLRPLLGDGCVYFADGAVVEDTGAEEIVGTVTVKPGTICVHEWADDGSCRKCRKQAEASVAAGGNTNYYASLGTACDAACSAADAAIVNILKDAKISRNRLELQPGDNSITINGGGHMVSGRIFDLWSGSVKIINMNVSGTLNVDGNSILSLTGCTIDARATKFPWEAVGVQRSEVKIADCTMIGVERGLRIGSGSVEIESGSIQATGWDAEMGEDAPPSVGMGIMGGSVVLSGGTFSGKTAAISIGSPDVGADNHLTLGSLLKAEHAYYDQNGAPVINKLQETELAGTVTVKPCISHSVEYSHTPGTAVHISQGNCLACGKEGSTQEVCDYGADGICAACGSTLSVVLTGADGLVYNGAPHTPGAAVVLDGIELAPEDYDIAYTDNIHAGTAKAAVTIGKPPYAFIKELPYTIAQKPVTPFINTAGGNTVKTYDGTADAPIGISLSLDGMADGDEVTAEASFAYDSADAGDAKTITATVTGLSGSAAGNYTLASNTATAAGKIEKAGQPAPAAPSASDGGIRDTSITLAALENAEYCMEGGNWQDSPVFGRLKPNCEYTFYARMKGDGNHHPSESSQGTVIRTNSTSGSGGGTGGSSGSGSGSTGGSSGWGFGGTGGNSGGSAGSGKPFLKDSAGRQGWDAISAEAEKAAEAPQGGTVTVDMNGASSVPGSFLDAIRDKDVTARLDMGGGIVWSVDGKSVTAENLGSTDLSVKEYEGGVPKGLSQETAAGRPHLKLRLAHNGEFGFAAELSFYLKSSGEAGGDQISVSESGAAGSTGKYAGMYANLFYYNAALSRMEFICAAKVGQDGKVSLPFTHASDYLVVLSESPIGGTDAAGQPQEGTGEGQPQTGAGDVQEPEGGAPAKVQSVKLSKTVYTYNGRAKKPAVAAVDTNGRKIPASNYKVTYKNNKKPGKATAEITFSGGYAGKVKKTFTIRPAGTRIKKTTALPGGFTVTWAKKTAQTSGYQVQYSLDANFKGSSTHSRFAKKASETAKAVKKLEAGKTYYVRIRTYKTEKAGGKSGRVFSAWSSPVRAETA